MRWSERVGKRLKLRDLHIVLAVAETGSMAKAAADPSISQPSVSKAIADVEHVLGLRLLNRGSRGIELTIYGRGPGELRDAPYSMNFARGIGAGVSGPVHR